MSEGNDRLTLQQVGREIIRKIGEEMAERKDPMDRLQQETVRNESLVRVSARLNAELDIDNVVRAASEELVRALNPSIACVSLYDKEDSSFYHADSFGLPTEYRKNILFVPLGVLNAYPVQKLPAAIEDLQALPNLPHADLHARHDIRSVAYAPVVYENERLGLLTVATIGKERHFLGEDLALLGGLADLTAQALYNAHFYDEQLRAGLSKEQAQDAVLERWAGALDRRDREREGHTHRVTEMTLHLADVVGMTDAEKTVLKRGSLMHDVGKIGVPELILHKPNPLNDDEWDIMRRHPLYAYEMLSAIDYLASAIDVPYCHHEKWDGTGYPRGLKGSEIPLSARLFAVADVYDALGSDRPYRQSWEASDALEYIVSLAGTHFDPEVVKVFLEMIERRDANAGTSNTGGK